MRLKTIYVCQNCEYQSPKWVGKCPQCNEWNTFIEDVEAVQSKSEKSKLSRHMQPGGVSEISKIVNNPQTEKRLATRFPEFNRVLGSGFKLGSLVLLSGEPGIGKSTLTLQICQDLAAQVNQVLYISGEESTEQISGRALRLKVNNENISLLSETNLESILNHLHKNRPDFVIIDSIQVLSSMEMPSLSGSINQVKFCTEALMEYAKANNTVMFIIGHVTKDGNLAGPRVLEHLVDTVLFLEGERSQNYRILRGLKNRFGSTNELAIFEMLQTGLEEVANPSEIFLQGRLPNAIGSAITVSLEGEKALLLEVQALTNTTVFGYPKRTSSGIDLNRLQLIAAVIQKYLKMNLNSQDIYLNVIGGIKISETASDLSMAMAIISSFKKIPLPNETIFLAEIGLSGELRPVGNLEKRLKEAEKMGFQTVVTATTSKPANYSGKIKIVTLKRLEEAVKLFIS
ncbi:MAG: DNA repair protein RadA [Candidatus Altimarinota bacterium]